MRLTRAGEYAIRCVLYLSEQEKGVVASRNEIADAMDIPRDFLTKIAQQLARAGFVEIVQGPKGGIRLTSSPQNLSLLDVVELINGEIFLNDCIINPEICSKSKTCSVHKVWEKARKQLRDTLREATFDSMLQEGTCFNHNLESDKNPKEE